MPKTALLPITPEIAIAAALRQDWKEAIRINMLLIKENKTDVDALNRLGFAFLMSGQFTQAKKSFENVLKLDTYNQIALKNIRKLTGLKRKDLAKSSSYAISPLLFLEEPGKTKIVVCVNPAPNHILSALSAGCEVILKAKNHCVEIRTDTNMYLAALPDDLSFKLLKLIDGGNRYQVIIKSIGKNTLTVLLREQVRGKRFSNMPSFITKTSYMPTPRSEDKGDGPDVTPTEEESTHNEEPN